MLESNIFDWSGNEQTVTEEAAMVANYNESYDAIVMEMIEKCFDTDHIQVNEDGTFQIYSKVEALDEAASETTKAKKKALKQIKAAMKETFKDTKSKLKISSFSFIGEIPFVNGSTNTVAIAFTKKGRHALMLALAAGGGAALGAASVVVPPAMIAAPVLGAGIAMNAESKNEKDVYDFIQEHRGDIQKALDKNVTDYKVTFKMLKDNPTVLFTIKKK